MNNPLGHLKLIEAYPVVMKDAKSGQPITVYLPKAAYTRLTEATDQIMADFPGQPAELVLSTPKGEDE